MKKRLLPLLLSLALCLSALPAALAASPSTEDMAQVLSALDIMTGDQYGDLMLGRRVTRAEFTKLAVAASPMGKNVGASTTVSPYPDVPSTAWEAPYVEAAVAAGLVQGNLYGLFEPGREITLQEGVTIAVRLLGYADSDFSGTWPAGQMTLCRNLELDRGISLSPTAPMTRGDAMCLFYNLLTAKTKAGQVYLTTLGHSLNAAGEIDRVGLINAAMDGPVAVLGESWQSKLPFPVQTAAVYRNGLPSAQPPQQGDVVYWSKSMHTLWAYSNKVTGMYQAVSPTPSAPGAVTVAGKTYPIETADAAYALSNLGPYQVGDTVTLLLGRDGGVAAVTTASAISGTVYGVISSVDSASYTDQSGSGYSAKTALITATDGNTYSYPLEPASTLKVGQTVQVTVRDGAAQVKRLSQSSSVEGRVSADGKTIGGKALADGAEVLDVDTDTGRAVRIYPSRLSGMELKDRKVLFSRENAQGEIDRLILDDVTGDIHSYGVLTEVSETDLGTLAASGSYTFDVGGQTYRCVTSGKLYRLAAGPVKVEGALQAPEKLGKLTAVRLSSLDADSLLTVSNAQWPLWDGMAVYVQTGSVFTLSSPERVRTGYDLTGYYDAPAKDGGRIRVVIARAK